MGHFEDMVGGLEDPHVGVQGADASKALPA